MTSDQAKYASEREMSLKLIRTLLATKEGVDSCPLSLLRMLVAVAEHSEDRLRNPCIETLCELAVLSPRVAFDCGAIKLLFTFLVEGPKELLDGIVLTVLYLLDAQDARFYIRPSVELEAFFIRKKTLTSIDGCFILYRCLREQNGWK